MSTRSENLAALAKLMEKIDIGMLTTIGPDGHLVSRPLSTQDAEFDGERVWFFTDANSPKVGEIERNPKVNLAYASKDRNTYISAAGEASISRDRARIDAYWNDAMKAFFPKGKDDPDLVLIEVALRTIEYWDGPGSWIGKATAFVVARVTGNDDVMSENRIVDVQTGRSRKAPGTDARGNSASAKRGAAAPLKRKTAGKKTASSKTAASRTAGARKTAKKSPATKAATKKRSTTPRKAAKRSTAKAPAKARTPANTAKRAPARKAAAKKAGGGARGRAQAQRRSRNR